MKRIFDMDATFKENRLYNHWVNTHGRVSTRSGYEDVLIAKEWYRFSNFYSDMKDRFGSCEKDYVLDKDILSCYRVYSKWTCCFIPVSLNRIAPKNITKRRKNLPVGVFRDGGRFSIKVNIFGVETQLYGFKTADDAFKKYRKIKASYLKTLATLYKDSISNEAYTAIRSYKVVRGGIEKPDIDLDFSKIVD